MPRRLFRKAVQQGHSKRRGEAYSLPYVEPLSVARTPLADFVNSLLAGANPFMGGDGTGQQMPDTGAMMSGMGGMGGMKAPPPEGVLYMCVADVQVTERGKEPSKATKPGAGSNGQASTYQMRTVAHVLQKT